MVTDNDDGETLLDHAPNGAHAVRRAAGSGRELGSTFTLIEREVSDEVYLTYRDLDGWRGRCARVFMLTGQGSRSAELLISLSDLNINQ